jgi:hypothetical protein
MSIACGETAPFGADRAFGFDFAFRFVREAPHGTRIVQLLLSPRL